MSTTDKLTEYELDCLAHRLRSDFVSRKLAVHGGDQLLNRYENPAYLQTFRAAVKAHHPRLFRRIINGAFAAFADPQPEDLVGGEAVQRTMAASSPIEALVDDAEELSMRLEDEVDWLKRSLSFNEYRGQAILRFLAIRQIDANAVPASAILAMAREALLEANIDPEAVDALDRNLPVVDVRDALEEAAEIVAMDDEVATSDD